MKKKKIIKIVWFDETEERLPYLQEYEDDLQQDQPNGDEIVIRCSFQKPKQKAKKLRITVEEI